MMRIESTDETARLHDAAARLGYEVAVRDLRKYYPGAAPALELPAMERVRAEARDACVAVPARAAREIYSAAYDAGVKAAVADLESGKVSR